MEGIFQNNFIVFYFDRKSISFGTFDTESSSGSCFSVNADVPCEKTILVSFTLIDRPYPERNRDFIVFLILNHG